VLQLGQLPERTLRVLMVQCMIAFTLTITVVLMWLGDWSWWPVFLLFYAIGLGVSVVFLSRTPRSFWPRRYRFRNPYSMCAVAFMSLLIPLGIFRLVYVRTPLEVGNVEYSLLFPSGDAFPLFSVMLPMLGLQAFFSSIAYLTVSRLIQGTDLYVDTDPLSLSFLLSAAESFLDVNGTLYLAVVTVWISLLEGNVNATLSWIALAQFFLPITMLAAPRLRRMARKYRKLRGFYRTVTNLLSVFLPVVLPGAPSVLTIIWAPTDWRSPLLASSTLSTLCGMALAWAYVLPRE